MRYINLCFTFTYLLLLTIRNVEKFLEHVSCFFAQVFFGTSFLYEIEQIFIQHKKVACTWSKLWGFIGWLCFQLVSSIIFIVRHVCCASFLYQKLLSDICNVLTGYWYIRTSVCATWTQHPVSWPEVRMYNMCNMQPPVYVQLCNQCIIAYHSASQQVACRQSYFHLSTSKTTDCATVCPQQ